MTDDYPDPDNYTHRTITALKTDDAPTGAEICTKCGTRVERM